MQRTICGHEPPDRHRHSPTTTPAPVTGAQGNDTSVNETSGQESPEVVVHRRKRSPDVESGIMDDFHFGKILQTQ